MEERKNRFEKYHRTDSLNIRQASNSCYSKNFKSTALCLMMIWLATANHFECVLLKMRSVEREMSNFVETEAGYSHIFG